MKIIITAANGFMGKHLVEYFSKNHEVIALVRSNSSRLDNCKTVFWDGKTAGAWAEELEGADAVINLAGKSVNCRYNGKNKAEIYASRLDSTRVLGEALRSCVQKPSVWINAASGTIYSHSLHEPMTEEAGEMGSGFSVDVCQQWENVFFSFSDLPLRQVALRTAIVLGKDGGVMLPFRNLTRWGFGGKMGNGMQQFSWIHIEDVCRSVDFILTNEQLEGAVNISSPKPIRNEIFMQVLRKRFHRSLGISSPIWMLELGARLIKTETELILKSRYVFPEKLVKAGFQWKYDHIEAALNHC
jgi:uncharacterized protein (TIGR01777 family)